MSIVKKLTGIGSGIVDDEHGVPYTGKYDRNKREKTESQFISDRMIDGGYIPKERKKKDYVLPEIQTKQQVARIYEGNKNKYFELELDLIFDGTLDTLSKNKEIEFVVDLNTEKETFLKHCFAERRINVSHEEFKNIYKETKIVMKKTEIKGYTSNCPIHLTLDSSYFVHLRKSDNIPSAYTIKAHTKRMNPLAQTKRINEFMLESWSDEYEKKIESFRNLNHKILDEYTKPVKEQRIDRSGYIDVCNLDAKHPYVEIYNNDTSDFAKYIKREKSGLYKLAPESTEALKTDAFTKQSYFPISVGDLSYKVKPLIEDVTSMNEEQIKKEFLGYVAPINADIVEDGNYDEEGFKSFMKKPFQVFVTLCLSMRFLYPDHDLMSFERKNKD